MIRSPRPDPDLHDVELLHLLMEHAQEYAILLLSPNGSIQSWNAGAERLLGYEADEILGKPNSVLFAADDIQAAADVDTLNRAKQSGKLTISRWCIRKDQSRFWCSDSLTALRQPCGTLRGFAQCLRDETCLRRSELAMLESESAAVGNTEIHLDSGRFIRVNQNFCRMTGYSAAELSEMTFLDITHPQDREPNLLLIRQFLEGQQEVYEIEKRYICKDGKEIWANLTGSLIRDSSGKAVRIFGTVLNITERKRIEQLLRTQTAQLNFALASTGMGLWLNEMPLESLNWDERTRELFFVPPGVPPTVELFWERLHPDDRERTQTAVDDAIRNQTLYTIDHRVVDPVSQAVRWIRSAGQATYDQSGTPVRFDGINYDITEQKQTEAELRQAVSQLAEADRRKDQFLATMAHELRNPLAPIRNAVQILKIAGPPDPQLAWGRDVIDRQVAHMARLLDDLLDVSRITRNQLDLRKRPTTLEAVVECAIETSRPLIDKMNHTLTITLPGETITLDADAMRLAQVFANLLNNAAKYSDVGGQIDLTAATEGDRVMVSVRDNGIGIDPTHRKHVFEMFSQTTPALERSQGGLGIGLSLVKGLVELHGGEVEAKSDGAGKGSEFIVHLPMLKKPQEPHMKDDEADSTPVKSSFRILIADDNEDGAKTLAAMLDILGNETWIAVDGEAAIAAASELRPDVILLDIGLPKLNGYKVCRHIRQQQWGDQIAIVAHTGWGQEEDRQKTLDAGFDHHLVKPANMAKLTRLLQDLQPLNP